MKKDKKASLASTAKLTLPFAVYSEIVSGLLFGECLAYEFMRD